MRFPFTVLLAMVSLAPSAVRAQSGSEDHVAKIKAGTVIFQEVVAPAFRESCVRCHGGEKIRADFDLTDRESFLRGSENGAVVDLASPGDSLLLGILRHEEEPEMPPKGDPLSPEVIRSIEEWIGLGAPFDKPLIEKKGETGKEMTITENDRNFWSFRPLAATTPPETEGKWARGSIDRFILAGLRERNLEPTPEAHPRAFIRRVYLDLIGWPPTPEEVNAYLAAHEKDPDAARESLIDELLASPHFGERWARHWLDAARFAESHGFEQDYDRKYAYHYRDFVIQAFNSDMPFDQFVRWQIAGDEIAPEDPLAMMATGFLGAGVFPTQLTEKEFESARYDELDDMIATTGTAMLGLTIGCARCHDHKFDPIPVKDYYQLISTFTTTIRSEIEIDLDPEGYREALAKWEMNHAPIESELEAWKKMPATVAAFDAWLESDALGQKKAGEWTVLSLDQLEAKQGSTLTKQEDGSVLVSGKKPAQEVLTFLASTKAPRVTHFRIEALADDSLPRKGPGRAGNGNFALSDLKVFVRPAGLEEGEKRREVTIASARATHEQNAGNLSVASSFDQDPKGTGWAVDRGGIGKDQAAVFALSEPIESDSGVELEFELTFSNNREHTMGRPRLSIASGEDPPVVVGSGTSEALAAAFVALERGELLPEHRDALFPLFASEHPEWGARKKKVDQSLAKRPQPDKKMVQVSSEGFPPTKHHADGRGFPHFYPETHFLNRGDPNQKQGVASPGFLQVLMREGTTSADWQEEAPEDARTSHRRRGMANWITDPENGAGHLLARVIVNRVWHHHFGRGIVATPNDFGLQGAEPSHPELLDFLARELIADGWKLKPLHRKILLSAAYGQGSGPDAEKAAIDPDNELLWRFSPRRLEAEAIRDSMLAISGQLDRTMFGPGTLDEANRRRSIYFFLKRSRLVPIMQVFDQPEPLVSQGSRPSTTVAPQALLFMNNPQVVRWADALAERLEQEDSGEAAVNTLYELALNRSPTPGERARSLGFLEAQAEAYGGNEGRRLALADLCQVIFGLNEFVYLP